MSMDHDKVLRAKLYKLECHFTWALSKDDTDLGDLLNRLEDQFNLDFEKKKQHAQTYSITAYVKFLLGLPEDAIHNLMTSVKLCIECHGEEYHKSLIVPYGNLAWINYHMKNYTECESYLQKLQKINDTISSESSSVPEVLGAKGWTYLKFSKKYYERAKECFKKALELEPDEGEWNAGYAIALYRTEYGSFTAENSPTIKQLGRAIETNPDDDVLKVLLGLRLAACKKYNEAESLIEEALKKSPDHPHVIRYAGKFFRNRNVDRSIALLIGAFEHCPNSKFMHHQLALCYKMKKVQLLQDKSHHSKVSEVQQIRDQIIYHLEMATTLAPRFIHAMSDLALHYGERHEMTRAEELFQTTFKTAEEKNDLYAVHFYYAEFQMHCNRCEASAVKHYKECLKMNPVSPEGKKSVYSLKQIAEKRINKNAGDGEAYGILGFLHKEKGEKRRAIECYEKALSLGVDNDEYLSDLNDLRMSLQ